MMKNFVIYLLCILAIIAFAKFYMLPSVVG